MKHKRPDKKFWVRIMAGLLVLLMLLSATAMTIQLLTMNAYASDITPYYTADGSDLLIAVGLMYADGVTVGFETQAKNGFIAGALDENRQFTPLHTIDIDCVSVTCDANLSKKGMTYYISPQNAPAIGGWHLETSAGADASALFDLCRQTASPHNLGVFHALINGLPVIRIGQFANEAEARAAAAIFNDAGIEVTTAAPSPTGVSVVDPYTDSILFEFDGGTETALGLMPRQNGPDTVYLVTPAKNTYGGIFRYARWKTDSVDGVAVTNILPLEEYVEGVLPWEISNRWSRELLRTFAVAVRSYALSSRKHLTFDLCNDTCCQAYNGRNRTNDAITDAVAGTTGLVLAYGGEIARTYYSSSTGGTTVAAADAWNSSVKYPYLQAIITPWEQYTSYPNDSWTAEYTPARLLDRLNKAGYETLSGGIDSVEILSYAENSSYVNSIKITDIHGTSVIINRSDAIRTALGLNSANFVVAKAGQTVQITDYTLDDAAVEALLAGITTPPADNTPPAISFYVLSDTVPEATPVSAGESLAMTGELGMEIGVALDRLNVITDSGVMPFNITERDMGYTDTISPEEVPHQTGLPAPASADIITTRRTVTAQGSAGSFVFIGRGWGHGVGLSQYGAKALADLGYDHQTILKTYYPGTEILDYRTVINNRTEGGNING
ncbi:MAG: SpoIID/LytB domain-containing protein [Eubacteriales bacterium]|nr:SpoIID/LytB domain-containing protein [Eubacteriales bacterium]